MGLFVSKLPEDQNTGWFKLGRVSGVCLINTHSPPPKKGQVRWGCIVLCPVMVWIFARTYFTISLGNLFQSLAVLKLEKYPYILSSKYSFVCCDLHPLHPILPLCVFGKSLLCTLPLGIWDRIKIPPFQSNCFSRLNKRSSFSLPSQDKCPRSWPLWWPSTELDLVC